MSKADASKAASQEASQSVRQIAMPLASESLVKTVSQYGSHPARQTVSKTDI